MNIITIAYRLSIELQKRKRKNIEHYEKQNLNLTSTIDIDGHHTIFFVVVTRMMKLLNVIVAGFAFMKVSENNFTLKYHNRT